MAFTWQPTLLILGAYLLVVFLYLAAYHGLDHLIGWDEIGKRWKLIRLAATGNDYRLPDLDPGMFTHQSFDEPGTADDPVTAILVRSSEAERRWYALHHLVDQWEDRGKHQRVMQPDEERILDRWLHQQFREATEEARDEIQARIQMHTHRDSDEMAERYIIEDPSTGYKQRVQMADVDLVRFDADGHFPPPVQQRIDSFPQHVLREVEQRSETLEPRV